MIRRSALREASVATLYVAVALVQTAPLVAHAATSVPVGNYLAPAVPRLNLWILWWNADRLLHAYRGYWQAPIFHPDPSSFAYSEPQWLTGLAASPFWWLTGRPALAYNAALVIALALNGWSGRYLLRTVGVASVPALCGGLVTEMLPIAADQIGVLQSTMLFPIPMMLASLVRFGRTGAFFPAVASALWMAVCYHTSSNTAFFFGPIFALVLLVVAGPALLRLRAVGALAAAGAIGVVLVAPIAVPQNGVLATVERSRADSMIRLTSASPASYARMPPTNLLRARPQDRSGYALYPGTGVLVLAAVGSWYGIGRRRLRRWTACAGVAIAACVLLSFGPIAGDAPGGTVLGIPYEVLAGLYPRFAYVRNLWRYGGLAQIFLASLAGLGLAACFRRSGPLGILVTIAVLAELVAAPVPLVDVADDATRVEWIRWLRGTPADSTIVHLPMADGTSVAEFDRTSYWMSCQMYHGRRMVNGYSAYVPAHVRFLTNVMAGFPDANSIRALRYFGIEHVLAAADWMTPERAEKLQASKDDVVPELTTPDVTIYRVAGASAATGHGLERPRR